MKSGAACARADAKLAIVLLHARSHAAQPAPRSKVRLRTIVRNSPAVIRHNEVQLMPYEAENNQRVGSSLGVTVNVEQGLLNDPKQRPLKMMWQLV